MIITLDEFILDYRITIKGVLHIGAHIGQECDDYINHGIANIILFEPIRSNYSKLIELVPQEIKTHNIALGNQTGEIEMFVETANKGMSCSILEPGTHSVQYPWITFDNKEIVKIDKLDNIEFDRTLYNMINIDVQGYELEVFKGANETLKTIDIIFTEINMEEVYKGCCMVADLDLFLSHYGFRRVVSVGDRWGDALYIK